MNEKNNNNSGLPVLIIIGVLLVAVIGGWWFYTSSKTETNPIKVTNANTNINKPANQQQQQSPTMTSSVPGAQPPHFKGSQNSPVIIEEFADFQCPTCATLHGIMNEVNSMYGSRVKFIYRNFPLSQIHPNAYDAALAAEAAGMQGKFWDMQNILFQNQQRWSGAAGARTLFESYAETIGLDVEKFKEDMSGMAAKQRVDADIQRARSMNVNSTPTIIINSRPVTPDQMTLVGIKQLVDAELARTSGGGQNQTAPPSATAKPAENKPAETNKSNAGNK